MPQHTPGPWIARGEIVMAHRPHPVGGYNEESVLSAARPWNERLANARLIAAAPEMLRLLQQTVAGHAMHGQCGCGVCDARTLLAKIEGVGD